LSGFTYGWSAGFTLRAYRNPAWTLTEVCSDWDGGF